MPELLNDRYLLLRSGARGGGGMSSGVHKGVDHRDGSHVAVKFVQADDDDLTRKVFDREVQTLQKLQHPNIVGFRDSGVDRSGTYFIVLDWIERNLDDVLAAPNWDTWTAMYRTVGKPVVDALAYSHLMGVEHRDIKPTNVLVDDDGRPLLADFGISKIQRPDATAGPTLFAFRSGVWAPPEVESPKRFVRDVYSVGLLLIQCMCREPIRERSDIAPALRGLAAPPVAVRLLEACVSDDVEDRPANASELADELRRIHNDRVVQQNRSLRSVSLELTQRAVGTLTQESAPDRRKAADMVRRDLSGLVFATYRYDRRSGEHDRETVLIVGEEFKYTLKKDRRTPNAFAVVGVAQPEYEPLEALRRRALQLPPLFSWAIETPVAVDKRQRGYDYLMELLSEHADGASESSDLDDEPDDFALFDLWLRILDAREELARGDEQPLRYVSREAEKRLATFELADEPDSEPPGTEWRVKDPDTGHLYAWGEVAEQDGTRLVLRGRKFGSTPGKGVLVPHIGPTQISLTRQRNAVQEIRAGTTPRADFRELLVQPEVSSPPVPIDVGSWHFDLDDSKKEAVRLALGTSDLLVVQGPPGTGKTSFITETVRQFLNRSPEAKVLIASQTHVAVDNALERLDRSGIQRLVRLAGADTSRVDGGVQHLILEGQLESWAKRVRKAAEAAINARAQGVGIDPVHARAAVVLEEMIGVQTELKRIREALNRAVSKTGISELTTSLDLGRGEPELQQRVDSLEDLLDDLRTEAQQHLDQEYRLDEEFSTDEARVLIDLLVGDGPQSRRLLALLELQGEWLQRIQTDDSVAPVFMADRSVVAGTCTGFLRHRAVRSLTFDLCIVDEASKATATEALVPLSRAKSWILVGDSRQLPPMDEDLLRARKILSERDIEPSDVTHTLFERLAEQLPEASRRMLTEQYRMIRPIGDLISECFYEGQLKSPVSQPLPGWNTVFGRPFLWLDTGPLGERRRESMPGGEHRSYANSAEASQVMRQLSTLNAAIDRGLIDSGKSVVSVLVISPYKSQVEDLRRRVRRDYAQLARLEIDVMSVDAVQGREADVTIISLTRSNARGELGFLGESYWRRINVALSRARQGLIIVGDADFIAGTRGALRSVLDYAGRNTADCEIRPASV